MGKPGSETKIWEMKDKELINILIGRNGGKTTTRIIDKILEKPQNKNQLSKSLNLNYSTITYHLSIATKHNYVIEEKVEKNYYYRPSSKLYNSMDEYILIRDFLKETKK